MKRVTTILVSVGASLLATAVHAQQPRPERPYRGLFGGGVGDAEQVLTVSASAGAGSDESLNESGGGQPLQDVSSAARPSAYGQGGLVLQYTFSGRRFSAGASGGLASRYFHDGGLITNAYNGSGGFRWQVSRRLTLGGTQVAAYQPFLTLRLVPQIIELPVGHVEQPSLDFDGAAVPDSVERGRQDQRSQNTGLELATQVGRRGSLSLGATYSKTDAGGPEQDLTTAGGSVRYLHNLSKGLAARLGYTRVQGLLPEGDGDRPVALHNFDVGFDFNRTLSFSRRTTFGFQTGSSAVQDADRLAYRVTGNANLRHEIGRTWSAALVYARQAEFVARLSDPVFSDNVGVHLTGLMHRRLQFRSTATAAIGTVGVGATAPSFASYSAVVGTSLALNRYMALTIDGVYFRYEFGDPAVVPAGLARDRDSRGVRASLALWAPLLHRSRRPDATR